MDSVKVIDPERSRRVARIWAKRRAERNSKWIVDSNNIVHIPLGKGMETIIDVVDMDRAKEFTWTLKYSHTRKSDGFISYYAYAKVPRGNPNDVVQLHNIIMEPQDGFEVDHIDRDGLNCTRSNMRIGLPRENSANKASVRNVRNYRGVYRRDGATCWTAKLMVDGKFIYKTRCKTERDAVIAYNELAKQYHGAFAVLSVVPDDKCIVI